MCYLLISITWIWVWICQCNAEDITLTSTLGRRQATCPGEVVVYTCIALHATAVEWTAEPDVQGVIFFQDDTVTERTVGGFQLALTGRVPNGTGFSDLTSTLTVTAIVSRTATVIRCVSGGGRKELELMVVTSPPPPPLNPVYHIQQYGRHNFTTIVRWGHPEYNGVVPDNYTISGTHLVTTSSATNETTLTLHYNELQTISITANKCNGSSSTTAFTIYEAGCGDPYPPNRGFIEDFNSAEENATITYHCNPGLVPQTQVTAVCTMNWNPDPTTLECVSTSSVPGELGTVTHSLSLTQTPTPTLSPSSPSILSSASITPAAVGATAVVSLLVGFIAGALSGTVATVCITRWNKSSKRASNMPEPQQTVPVYEEVGAQSQKIELKENVAYGPVKVD